MPDIDLLPFPVAHPLSYARSESVAIPDRIHNTLFAAYQAVRTTALLLLADYLACDTVALELAAPIQGLRLPHWGEWVHLADKLARFWDGQLLDKPSRDSSFPALRDAWLREAIAEKLSRDSDLRPLVRAIPVEGSGSVAPIRLFQRLRNSRAHEQGTRTGTEESEAQLLGHLLPLLERVLAGLFPPGAFSILRRVEGAPGVSVIRLHGPHRDMRFPVEILSDDWAFAFRATGVTAITGGEPDDGIPVFPFFLPLDPENPREPGGSGGLLEDLYLLDGVSERRAAVLGVLGHRDMPKADAEIVREVLNRKRVDFGLTREATTRWSLAGWSLTTATSTLASVTGRKYFPAFYLERSGVDDVVYRALGIGRAAAPASRTEGTALLLLGDAGAGKSSLVARLVESLLPGEEQERGQRDAPAPAPGKTPGSRRPGLKGIESINAWMKTRWEQDVVLYLSGAADYNLPDASSPGDTHLARVLLRKAGVRPDAFHSAEQFIERLGETARDDDHAGRRVWILLDGLNEAERFQDLVKALDGFLPVIERHPWLRLVVTMRSGAYHSLARRDLDSLASGSAVFKNASRWHPFDTGRPQQRPGERTVAPFLEIRPFQLANEGQAVYELRQKAPGMPSCPAGYGSLTQPLRNLVLSPLRLHLFHEAFAGVDHPPALLRDDVLFDTFLDRLTDEHPGLAETLPAIGRLMLEKRRAFLPLEEAVDFINRWYSRTSMSAAERHAKLNPMEELVSASILLRPTEEGPFDDCAGYQFTHQRLAEAVLRRALLQRISPRKRPTRDELLQWAELAVGMPWPTLTPSASPEETARAMGLFYEYLTDAAIFPELTGALEAFAAALVEHGDGATAADLLEIVCETVRQRLFASALLAFARLHGEQGAPPDEAVRFFEELEEAMPTRKISVGYLCVAVRLVLDRLERAGVRRPTLLLARLLVSTVCARFAREPQWGGFLNSSLDRLWELVEASGNSQEGRRIAEDALVSLRTLIAQKPDCLEFRAELAISLNRGARLAIRNGDLGAAREMSTELVDVRKEICHLEPDSDRARYALAAASHTSAGLALASADVTGAIRGLATASGILGPLRTPSDLPPEIQLELARHHLLRYQLAAVTGEASTAVAEALSILGALEAAGFEDVRILRLRREIEKPAESWRLY